MRVMPALQSGYQETGRTVLAAGSTDDAMGINPHQLCNGASRRQWVGNHHDVHGLVQQNGSAGNIMRNGRMNSSNSLSERSRELSRTSRNYHK